MHPDRLFLWIALGLFCVKLSVVKTTKPGDSSLVLVNTEEGEDHAEEGFVEDDSEDDMAVEKHEPFIPTKEWQTVKKDQPIPRGLHVRYNLQTGKVEAKLLDEEDDQDVGSKDTEGESVQKTRQEEEGEATEGTQQKVKNIGGDGRLGHMKTALEEAMQELSEKERKEEEDALRYWKDGDKEGMYNLKKKSFSPEELKEALKKFKQKDDDVKDESILKEKKSFRSMEEIRSEFAKMNVDMKTDLEILDALLTRYRRDTVTVEERISLLEELEYHLHQIDNAIGFADMDGLEPVTRDLNHSSPEVRSAAAMVIGAASQSNPKVQVHVIKAGGMHHLIRLLSTDPSNVVRRRVLYALSCLVRHFPFAQERFVANGGVQTLTQIIAQRREVEADDKLRQKALTLVMDLLTEQTNVEFHSRIRDSQEFERLQQYKKISFKSMLLEQDWCKVASELLEDPDSDIREATLTTIRLLLGVCHKEFLPLEDSLRQMQDSYSKAAGAAHNQESVDSQKVQLIEDILTGLSAKENMPSKDEL